MSCLDKKQNGSYVCNHKLSVYAPNSLNHFSNQDGPWGDGYESEIWYTIRDQFSSLLPSTVGVNENFTGSPVPDYADENWSWGGAGGVDAPPAGWYDWIGRGYSSEGWYPSPQNPQNPIGSTKIDHRPGDWYVGSKTPGNGVKVHSVTWQIYRDHARHE